MPAFYWTAGWFFHGNPDGTLTIRKVSREVIVAGEATTVQAEAVMSAEDLAQMLAQVTGRSLAEALEFVKPLRKM